MTRKCTKCNFESTSLFGKKNRCWKCGSKTTIYRCRQLKDKDCNNNKLRKLG